VQFVEPAQLAPTPAAVPVFQPAPAPSVQPDREPESEQDEAPEVAPLRAAGHAPASPLSGRPLGQSIPVSPAVGSARPVPAYVNGSTPPRATVSAAVSAPARTVVTAAAVPATESNAPRQRRPIQETADLADEIEAMHPDISQTELARRLGISATRLRAVRREAREARRAAARH
jgi:hypothetical protein